MSTLESAVPAGSARAATSAEFPADKAGSYLLAINTGQSNAAPLLTGVTVPYSAEFRERESNEALIDDAGQHQARRAASRAR